jgi:N-formylglutamate amidohydrolase
MDDELWHVERGEGRVLATAIHDGHDLRQEVADLFVLPEANRLREEDPFTSRWTTIAGNRVIPHRSRFEVDLNRPPDEAVYRTPDDAWGLELWREPPSDDLVDGSMAEYGAFHDLVHGILTELEQRYGAFLVLDLHSYNHRRDGADAPPADPAGNPVVNLGTGNLDRDRWAPVIDRFLVGLGAQTVKGEPVDVRENVRFRGGHFSKWVTEQFPQSGCVLAVEMKKVYMDEWTGEPDEAVIAEFHEALAATLPGVIDVLGAR